MKLLKRSFYFLLTLLILILISLWVLSQTIKPETVKQFVNSRLTSITHKTTQIDGLIAWQLFPRPGVKVTDIQVGDKKQYEDYYLKINKLLFNLKITPLLRGHLVFSDIKVDGFTLQANLDTVPRQKPAKALSKSAKPAPAKQARRFAIERLMLTHGNIVLEQQNKRVTLENLQLGVEPFNIQTSSYPVQLKTNLSSTFDNNTLGFNLDFKGQLHTVNGQKNRLSDQFNAHGQLLLNDILFNQFKINTMNASLDKTGTALKLNPLTFSLYGGESIGDLLYQFDNNLLTINQTATHLHSEPLFNAFLAREIVSGSMDYSLHASAPLNEKMVDTLSAQGRLTLKDGAISGMDLNQVIEDTTEKLAAFINADRINFKETLRLAEFDAKRYSQGKTPFKLASLQYHLAEGVFFADSLLLQSDRLQLQGAGRFNIKTQDINGHLQATVFTMDEHSNVFKVQQLLGGNFPITVSGNIKRPWVLPDLKIINNILGRYLIKKALDKPVKDIEKQIKSLFQ